MNREYLKFLVSELLLLKDDTIFHTIPETSAEYNEIFGEIEDYVDSLNLNIRMIRRKLELIEKGEFIDVEKILEEEFSADINDLELKKNTKIYDKDIFEVDDDIKKTSKDLYRQVIIKLSPVLYDYDKEDFLKFQNAFRDYNIEKLRELCEKEKNILVTEKNINLEKIREDLEIEIASLYLEFPLNKIEMLENEDSISFNLQKLRDIYEDFGRIYAKLQEELNLKLARKIF